MIMISCLCSTFNLVSHSSWSFSEVRFSSLFVWEFYENSFFFILTWVYITCLLQKTTNRWSSDVYGNVYLNKEWWWLEASVCNVCAHSSQRLWREGPITHQEEKCHKSSKYYCYLSTPARKRQVSANSI